MPAMNPVSDAELASIQSDLVAAVLDKPCIIQRKTATKDAYGSETDVWNTISANGLMCGMSQPSAGELANYDYVIGSLAAWKVRLPVGTNVQFQDRLLIGGQTLVVQVLLDPHSYPGLLPVLASEVK